jgi:hypothetical protein
MFIDHQPFRFTPALPVERMKTYELDAPPATHFRAAPCEHPDVTCQAHAHGWSTTVDITTELGQQQANYIRSMSGRRYVEVRAEGGLTTFTFEPGQRCFRSAEHRIPLEREPAYRVLYGDWRGSELARTHARAADWVEDFAEHQDGIKTARERG